MTDKNSKNTKKSQNISNYQQCDDCLKSDETVRDTTCPFQEEIHNKIVFITVCDKCYGERVKDI